mgnify:CR=1 FL=1|tara:strand:- start:300 stop:425 length:126 start_codon:yes stop_codon:yes gene_type:complete
MTIEERIESLEKQKEIAKETFIKCQGAIEILREMLNEESKD